MQFATAFAVRVYRVGCNNDVITTASDDQRGTVGAGGQNRSDEGGSCSVFLRHLGSLAVHCGWQLLAWVLRNFNQPVLRRPVEAARPLGKVTIKRVWG